MVLIGHPAQQVSGKSAAEVTEEAVTRDESAEGTSPDAVILPMNPERAPCAVSLQHYLLVDGRVFLHCQVPHFDSAVNQTEYLRRNHPKKL